MYRNFLLLVLLALCVQSVKAQEITTKPITEVDSNLPTLLKNHEDSLRHGWWTRGTQLGANLSGSNFNSKWQGGGVNNFVFGGLFNNKAVFTKGKGMFTSDLQCQLAFMYNKPAGGSREQKKSLDRLFFDNKYSRKINDRLSWFAGLNLQTQFARGWDYTNNNTNLISNLFSPAYLTEGIGLDYKATPHLLISLGGATMRQTFVLDQSVYYSPIIVKTKDGVDYAYGVKRGNKVLSEMGLQAVASYDRNITKNINIKGRWQTFFAYAPSSLHPWDHRFNIIGTAKLNKYFNLNATIIGILDRDQIDGLQLSKGANLGFSLQL